MEGLEGRRESPTLPLNAAALREWVVKELPGCVQDARFQDRLALFAGLVELKREVDLAEKLALLLAAESPVHEGRSLERLAEPVSRKSLKRAAASRLETVRRRWPLSGDMLAFLRDRAQRLAAAEPPTDTAL